MEINKRNLVRSKKVEVNKRKVWMRKVRRTFAAMACQPEIISAIFKVDVQRQKTKLSSISNNSRHV